MTTAKAINCLITSASAKVLLVEAFQKVLHPSGGKVIAADMDANCCAGYFADAFERMPRDDAPDYEACLLDMCERHDISLLIPTRDGELQQLARMKDKLAAIGVTLPLPDASVLALCQDKKHFQEYCLKKGFPVLPIADVTLENAFPIFMRHRNGTFTGGGVMVESLSAFKRLGVDVNDYVLQPYVSDCELSCDLMMDFDGKPVQAVVRERLKLVNGESWRSQIVDLPAVEKLALDLATDLGLRGHNLVQFFYNQEEGPRVIEVNARFGGCSNLSIQSGLASPERLVELLRGDDAARTRRHIKTGLMSLRYATDRLVMPSD
ncbi:ATP-grasp domain-containing protein [Kordiimonas aestuarii]|uniref:ATP-grasp domain-containing protein n=1 Tax=Kordiimonas aestuarii TaxID=1005925 RepID=UPI0021D3BB3B|nr:ATP-grasp domain-containing protein [Kordiimonas aestuarii]